MIIVFSLVGALGVGVVISLRGPKRPSFAERAIRYRQYGVKLKNDDKLGSALHRFEQAKHLFGQAQQRGSLEVDDREVLELERLIEELQESLRRKREGESAQELKERQAKAHKQAKRLEEMAKGLHESLYFKKAEDLFVKAKAEYKQAGLEEEALEEKLQELDEWIKQKPQIFKVTNKVSRNAHRTDCQ